MILRRANVNSMKKILPIIIGLCIGTAVSVQFIQSDRSYAVFSGGNWWDSIVARSESFDWKQVFSSGSNGKDLYTLVHNMLLVDPEQGALKEIAQKYGLTKDEAKRVNEGSLVPVYNGINQSSPSFTQEDAYILMKNLQEDFDIAFEAYSLEKEIDVNVTPSEIFANGDLSDSGFDLVYDLSLIEEILFVEKIENTVGQPFSNELSSPYIPTANDQTLTDYVPSSVDVAVGSYSLSDVEAKSGSLEISGNIASTIDIEDKAFPVGDKQVPFDVLDKDLCPSDDSLAGAVGDYDDRISSGGVFDAVDSGDEVYADNDSSLSDFINSSDDNSGDNDEGGNVSKDGKVSPAKADNWLKEWCPYTKESDEAGLSAKIAICLSTKIIKKKVTSFQPGDSCIACEIDKINDYMNKTLSHSLVPNKVTGNIMESAKCKDAFGPFFDMQFTAISAPVPTPSNDDIIFGKNIFEEWRKFVRRYQIFPDIDPTLEFELAYAPRTLTQPEVFNSIRSILASKRAEAKQEIENITLANSGTNSTLYIQTVLKEVSRMSKYFDGYLKQFIKINEELCPAINEKDDI